MHPPLLLVSKYSFSEPLQIRPKHAATPHASLSWLTPARSLAAQQCAQVRTELALALARLSTRSSLVSNTRSAARQASTCNRTLLLRLVDLELRRWRDRATAAAASGNREVGASEQCDCDLEP